MGVRLRAVVVEAADPGGLAGFWAELLGWEPVDDGVLVVRPGGEAGFGLRFVETEEPKVVKNHMHLDLTSDSPEAQRRTVERVLALGGRHVDVGQSPEETHAVLGDPEGNELCVIAAGNRFLAGCGFVGALACDGSEAVGRFWSAALGWPLVWDQDGETAIQSPHGGSKLTWGGEVPRTPHQRVRFELVADGVAAETERLLSLGATRAGDVLLDPDGYRFDLV